MNRDGQLTSLWQIGEAYNVDKQTPGDTTCEVVIVGGGITGLSTGLLLQERGIQCIIVEAQNIGFGTTLGTTAHLNNFFDNPYYQVIKDFGKDNAVLLYHAAEAALDQIRTNIDRYQISCGYSDALAYLFATDEQQAEELQRVIEAGMQVGLPIEHTNENPFPIPYSSIALVSGQAKFNPADYINGLARAFEAKGGIILEHCRVKEVQAGGIATIITDAHTLYARHVVYATHIPPGINLLHFRCAPYRSYVVAARLKEAAEYPEDLGYDLQEPYHYYRTQIVDGVPYLIVGGEDHKTGHEENAEACFNRLEAHVRSLFDVEAISYRWSSQYFDPTDGLAYIGRLPGNDERVYTATGFGGNGMIYGTLSAIILGDLISTGSSKYEQLFNPARVKPVAGFANFVKENADVVKTFFKDKLSVEAIDGLAALAPGEGRLASYGGQSIGVYKDEQGKVHAVGPSCPHVRCNVAWNSAEKTWDCPCHGSRFSFTGALLTGPAQHDLERIELSGLD